MPLRQMDGMTSGVARVALRQEPVLQVPGQKGLGAVAEVAPTCVVVGLRVPLSAVKRETDRDAEP